MGRTVSGSASENKNSFRDGSAVVVSTGSLDCSSILNHKIDECDGEAVRQQQCQAGYEYSQPHRQSSPCVVVVDLASDWRK
jgi:hypothetical protein